MDELEKNRKEEEQRLNEQEPFDTSRQSSRQAAQDKQQNTVSNEGQGVNQVAPTPQFPPPSHTKLIIGVVIAIVLVVGVTSYFYISQRQVLNQQDIYSYIEDNNKTCTTDQDCVIATSGCGCGCPDYAVNKESKKEYESLYSSVCKNRGVACGIPCKIARAGCQNNQCVILDSTVSSSVSVDETSDWKTYRDEGYGFEVRFPDSWIIEFLEDSRIFLLTNTDGAEIEICLDCYDSGPDTWGSFDNRPITIGNREGISVFFRMPPTTRNLDVRIEAQLDTPPHLFSQFSRIIISFNPAKEVETEYKIFESILSTFKFIE